jgi:hypothetical protein
MSGDLRNEEWVGEILSGEGLARMERIRSWLLLREERLVERDFPQRM